MCRDHSTIESWGNLRGILHASQEGLSESSPLRSDGSRDSQIGRLSHMNGGQNQLKWGHRLGTQIR
jgi:hypothetical protein